MNLFKRKKHVNSTPVQMASAPFPVDRLKKHHFSGIRLDVTAYEEECQGVIEDVIPIGDAILVIDQNGREMFCFRLCDCCWEEDVDGLLVVCIESGGIIYVGDAVLSA